MAFAVSVNINKSFTVETTLNAAYRLLADVPKSASHFPKVARLSRLDKGCYLWEFEKIGLDRYSIQTIYGCRYTSDKHENEIQWEPVEGTGNAEVTGRWMLKRISEHSVQCRLVTSAEIMVPLPSFLKLLLAGLVDRQFKALVDQYIVNLRETLEEQPADSRNVSAAPVT